MKSFIRNSLTSNPVSRNRRLALTLLVSFCLTYMGQAFAIPMVCMIPANEMDPSPCHQMMSESSDNAQLMIETATNAGTMSCCDQADSVGDGLTVTSHDCSCSDSGCAASLIFITSFPCGSLTIGEQLDYYSTIGFPNQIDSALFRPPIA